MSQAYFYLGAAQCPLFLGSEDVKSCLDVAFGNISGLFSRRLSESGRGPFFQVFLPSVLFWFPALF